MHAMVLTKTGGLWNIPNWRIGTPDPAKSAPKWRLPYRLLWEERHLVSVANLTREDGLAFLYLAPEIGIVTKTTSYPLNQANQDLADLRAGRFEGAAVLVP